MKLNELKNGETGFIIGVEGTGATQKRINELGFVKGQKVKAIKSAPLNDPVEYDIMGYKLTIRRSDAEQIEVSTTCDPVNYTNTGINYVIPRPLQGTRDNERSSSRAKNINVALVGNPNCGKTTIFNYATNSRERVANYSGVTVALKNALLNYKGYKINFVDLPGTYSLSSYSPEEMFVTDHLLNNPPDLIVNVVDASNLQRNLYLTSQLLDLDVKVVIALNMYDELNQEKSKFDYKKFSAETGVPVVPTVGTKGKGLNKLFDTVIETYSDQSRQGFTRKVSFGETMDQAIVEILGDLKNLNKENSFSRLTAIQLLDGDKNFARESMEGLVNEQLNKKIKNLQQVIAREASKEVHSLIIDRRYDFVSELLQGSFSKGISIKSQVTSRIDSLLTNKILGLPIFFGFIWFIFFCTFKIGEYPMEWFSALFDWFGGFMASLIPRGIINDLVVDGVIAGVGGVLVFLPNIMILFLLISLMEDTGYMARASFLIDKLMQKAGLHGKSFIPLLIGFGCNVPAIMATRTIENKRDRIITMLIVPFMSCSARLPVYVLFISAFFPFYRSVILFAIYAIGILAAFLTTLMLNKSVFRKEESSFIMEMPPYRMPTFKAIYKQTWFKTLHFLKKMGTVILLASMVIWALGYFPRDKEILTRYTSKIENVKQQPGQANSEISALELERDGELLEQSYISRIGKFIQPVFSPLGFDWKMTVSILSGVMAKEVVVSSMGVLYQASETKEEGMESLLIRKLRRHQQESRTPLVTYFGFLVFTLLYFPCMGTLIAIKKETARFRWIAFSTLYPLSFAWIVTFLIYQIGTNVF